jgi:hypothetical protein
MRVQLHIRELFPEGGEQNGQMRQHLLQLWSAFKANGLVSGNFVEEFCSGTGEVFCQRYWKLRLANHLLEHGRIPLIQPQGPDFRVEIEDRIVWIEAVAPTGGTEVDRVPARFIDPIAFIKGERERDPEWQSEAVRLPGEQLILRWTSAIRDKYRKAVDYIEKGIMKDTDAYIIAVNACNLGYGGLHAGEEWAIPLRSVFAFGDIQAVWNVSSGEIVEVERQHRPAVVKNNQSSVPTNIFLDEKYELISGILATDVSPLVVPLGRKHFELALIHNPLARAPLPVGLLGADVEIVARPEGDIYRLDWISR